MRILVALCLLCLPRWALGDDLERAKALHRKGEIEYGLGHYDLAIAHYQASYRLAPRPLRLLAIAQCYRQLKQPGNALRYYRLYLTGWARANSDRPPPYEAEVKGWMAAMERMATAQEAQRRRQAEQERLERERINRAQELRDAQRRAQDPRPRPRRAAAWVTLVAGIALGTTAATLYGVGLDQRNTAYKRYQAADSPLPAAGRIQLNEWERVEAGQTKIYVGHVLLGAAAATLGVSLYLWLRPGAKETSTRISAVPLPQGGGVNMSTTF